MGMTKEEINQPFIGVVSTWNESAPCNITLRRQAQSVKKGVADSKGTPREFTTITVTDGIAMGHQGMKASLASRETIADSIELSVRGHSYDGLVGLAGCDNRCNDGNVEIKYSFSLYLWRINITRKTQRKNITVQDVFEAVGNFSGGLIDKNELEEIEKVACPSAGSCGGQFTANTMACVSEALGLAIPNSTMAPAPYESRDEYGYEGWENSNATTI